MKITKIHIENFRALLNTNIDIEEKLSIIVGKNNTGKTSIKVLLDKFLCNESASFSLNDLNCKLQNMIVAQIEADMTKTPETILEVGVPEFAVKLFLHISYDVNDDLSNIASLITDLDMTRTEIIIGFAYRLKAENYLKLLASYKEKKVRFEKIKEKKPELNIPNALHLLKGGGIATFFDNIIYVADFTEDELSQYKVPIVDKGKEQKQIKRADVQRIINYKYISAERDSINPNANQSKTATLSTLAAKYWAVSEAAQENEQITNCKHDLEAQFLLADGDFTKIYGSVFQQTLDDITKLSDSKDKLRIESSFQARNLLSENATVMYEHDTTKLPEYYNGLGYMNLIEIIFKLTLIKRQFEEYAEGYGSDINLLFIEEPEAHMHPQMQVIFIKNIETLLKLKNNKKVQTLLSTHSSHIAANTEMDAFKYFISTEEKGVQVKNLHELKPKGKIPLLTAKSTPEEKAEAEKKEIQFATYRFVKQYITLNRAEVFFADKIIIIEGDTERILLPSIMKKIDEEYYGVNNYILLLSQNISIIEAGAYAKEFNELIKFLGVKTLIITDVDYIGADGKKSDAINAKGTSNSTIKYYLKQKESDATKYINEIKAATEAERMSDNILLSYQQNENEYWARSFEDAFIALNHEWLKSVSIGMQDRGAIKNAEKLTENTDYFTIAQECIKSKTAFAVSIIFESQRNGTPTNWTVPKYIKEGLVWLSR